MFKKINKDELNRANVLDFIIKSNDFPIYYLENEAQPDKFSSITESIWWATVSLATVGYGDVYPITIGGKIFATIISLVGIGIVAIPTGVISASFVEQISKEKKSSNIEL